MPIMSMPTVTFLSRPRGPALLLPALLALALLLPGPAGRSAEEAKTLTADAIKEMLTQYRAERAAADKQGLTKQFSPEWYQQADELAKQGEEALNSNRLLEAQESLRNARWHLPTLPAVLKQH